MMLNDWQYFKIDLFWRSFSNFIGWSAVLGSRLLNSFQLDEDQIWILQMLEDESRKKFAAEGVLSEVSTFLWILYYLKMSWMISSEKFSGIVWKSDQFK